MLLIEFNRFIIEPETREKIGYQSKLEKVKYNMKYDTSEEIENLEKAKQEAIKWHKNHYGLLKVFYSNDGFVTKKLIYSRCNCKKFWRDMISMGVLVVKEEN